MIVAMLFPTQSLVAQPSALNDLLKKAATAKDAQATVKNAIFLHGGRMSSIAMNGGVSQGLLARELLRQSLLLAAREDFQLETYDSNLAQRSPGGAAITLDLVIGKQGVNSLCYYHERFFEKQQPFSADPFPLDGKSDLELLAVAAEKASREQFRARLEAEGFKLATPPTASSELPASLLELLDDMNFVSQWHAVNLLHRDVRKNGLGEINGAALSRAYANLGLLTERHWFPVNKVLKARALLYAQRVEFIAPQSLIAVEAKAYALLAAGLPMNAQRHATKIQEAPENERAKLTGLWKIVTPWREFTLTKFDANEFPASIEQTVELFIYLRSEHRYDPDGYLDAVQQAVDKLPHCYRILATAAEVRDVGLARFANGLSPTCTAVTLYPRLAKIKELPIKIANITRRGIELVEASDDDGINLPQEFKLREELILALEDETSPKDCELPPAVLAHFIADHSFGEAIRTMDCLTKQLGVRVDGPYTTTYEPLYRRHPFAAAVKRYPYPGSMQELADELVVKDFDYLDCETKYLMPVFNSVSTQHKMTSRIHFSIVQSRHDLTVFDMQLRLFRPIEAVFAGQIGVAKSYYQLWPESTLAQQAMIAYNRKAIENEMPKWEKMASKDPHLLTILAGIYFDKKDYSKCSEVLDRACGLGGTLESYNLLAQTKLKLGDSQAAIEAYKGGLRVPSRGLNHARFNKEIALLYLARNAPEEALPFAEASAESYSEWGLRIAAEVNEKLRNLKEAEAYYRAISERYNTVDWFVVSHYYPTADRKGAIELAYQQIQDPGFIKWNPYLRANIAELNDDISLAIKLADRAVATPGSSAMAHILSASCYDVAGQPDKRNQRMKEGLEANQRFKSEGSELYSPALDYLFQTLREDIEKGAKAEFSLQQIIEGTKGAKEPTYDAFLFYEIARYCELRGKKDLAKSLYMQAYMVDELDDGSRIFASHRLAELGVDLTNVWSPKQKALYGPLDTKE